MAEREKGKPTIRSSFWREEADPDNPWYARTCRCGGYDFYGELLGARSWAETLFLQLKGDLPDRDQASRFDLLLQAVMNPGPRDLQNRAAMSAAIGGCPAGGALMAGFGASQGAAQGGQAVEDCMRMLKALCAAPGSAMEARTDALADTYGEGIQVPGYGLLYGERDGYAVRAAILLEERGGDGPALRAARGLESRTAADRGEWLRLYGVFAAGLADLGFSPEQGHGLYMVASSAGMLAHLCERYGEHWTEYPNWFGAGSYEYKGPAP